MHTMRRVRRRSGSVPALLTCLVVLTCGGPFDHAAGSCRDNVIVSADPVR
jgi:hypothetical protein